MRKQKTVMVQWLSAPSKVNRWMRDWKIKPKDIISIGRSPRGDIEIWYFCKKLHVPDPAKEQSK